MLLHLTKAISKEEDTKIDDEANDIKSRENKEKESSTEEKNLTVMEMRNDKCQ